MLLNTGVEMVDPACSFVRLWWHLKAKSVHTPQWICCFSVSFNFVVIQESQARHHFSTVSPQSPKLPSVLRTGTKTPNPTKLWCMSLSATTTIGWNIKCNKYAQGCRQAWLAIAQLVKSTWRNKTLSIANTTLNYCQEEQDQIILAAILYFQE